MGQTPIQALCTKTENSKIWKHFVLFNYEMLLWSAARPWACGPRLRRILQHQPKRHSKHHAPTHQKLKNLPERQSKHHAPKRKIQKFASIFCLLIMKCCSGQQLDPGLADPGSEESYNISPNANPSIMHQNKKFEQFTSIFCFLLMKCCSGQQLDPGLADPGSEE